MVQTGSEASSCFAINLTMQSSGELSWAKSLKNLTVKGLTKGLLTVTDGNEQMSVQTEKRHRPTSRFAPLHTVLSYSH